MAERLGQVIVCAKLETAYSVIFFFGGSQHQDRDGAALFTEAPQEIKPTGIPEPDIQDHQVRLQLIKETDRVGWVGRGHGLEYRAAQQEGDDVELCGVIVDDQDPLHSGLSLHL
jgi:hypothetical protein